MDMSDIDHNDRPQAPTRAAAPLDDASPGDRWRDLVAEIGAATAAPLTAALERIHALITSGRIDRASLRALRGEVEQARQAGMIGQQITRFASGRLRQSHERLSNWQRCLRGTAQLRTREAQKALSGRTGAH